MENREQQNQLFLRPIQDSDRQGDRNPRAFLKAKVIQASSQLNPDSDKIFKFSGQQLPTSKFGQGNLPKTFRFGAHQELIPTLNISQDCAGKTPALSHFSTSTSFGIPICCDSTPAANPVPLLFRSWELLSRKLKIFISVRMIELAGGLDHLRLKEYPWIPLSLTVTILNRLEKPVLLFAIFHFAAFAKSRERCRLRF